MRYRRSVLAFFTAIALAACSTATTAGGDDGEQAGGGSDLGGKGGSKGTGGREGGTGGTSRGDPSSTQQSEQSGGNATAGQGQGGSSKVGAGGREGGTGGHGGLATGGQDGGSHTGGKTGGGGKVGSAGSSGTGGTAGAVGAGGSAGSSGAAGKDGSAGAAGGPGGGHWVGTWAASPYYDSSKTDNPSLANSVLRQIVHVSLGGSQLRVQFSNLSGNGPVTIKSAHLALCKATSPVDSTIDTATDKPLAFAGSESATIPQGKELWSDPIDFTVPALGNLTISTAFGSVPSNLVGHVGSRTTSYVQAGSSDVSVASLASAKTIDRWYYISGVDVMADASAKGIVVIGDSITDGRGTDTNKNNRWTDILAAQLHANAATANVSVMNQGIGATNLVGATGTAAEARFARDVLGQSGVRYVIVLDGVNDINGGATFESMKGAYDKMISQSHGKQLLIYGATILPFGGAVSNGYYTASHETVRQKVNTYIRSGAFDGYIDFETALSDGANPPKIADAYAKWAETDGLHPGPEGYKKMGESVDLTLFTK